MKYSDAFESLHNMSLDIDLTETVRRQRIAAYLTIVREMPHPDVLPDEWRKRFNEHKDVALRHFVNLWNSEWEEIRETMAIYANNAGGVWKVKRRNWIIDLDTLRAFG